MSAVALLKCFIHDVSYRCFKYTIIFDGAIPSNYSDASVLVSECEEHLWCNLNLAIGTNAGFKPRVGERKADFRPRSSTTRFNYGIESIGVDY